MDPGERTVDPPGLNSRFKRMVPFSWAPPRTRDYGAAVPNGDRMWGCTGVA